MIEVIKEMDHPPRMWSSNDIKLKYFLVRYKGNLEWVSEGVLGMMKEMIGAENVLTK